MACTCTAHENTEWESDGYRTLLLILQALKLMQGEHGLHEPLHLARHARHAHREAMLASPPTDATHRAAAAHRTARR